MRGVVLVFERVVLDVGFVLREGCAIQLMNYLGQDVSVGEHLLPSIDNQVSIDGAAPVVASA